LLFASVSSESLFLLLLGLYTPALEEEFLYRGVIQSKLERVVSQRYAWVISGVLFGLGHVPNDFFGPFWVTTGGDPTIAVMRLAEQTAFGLLVGLLYMKSRTLIAPVLGHYFKNDLAVILESVLP
jgi:membrane protease YdiL (CAAX protease family)